MAKITKIIKGWLEYSIWAANWFEPENAGTAWQILVKTANGYQWVDLSSLWIIVKDSASPIDIEKVWAWTEQQYQDLSSYSDKTEYMTV